MTLAKLKIGKKAKISGYYAEDAAAIRLLELGLVPGTVVCVRRRAPFGGPIEVYLRGYALALRQSDAARITLEVSSR